MSPLLWCAIAYGLGIAAGAALGAPCVPAGALAVTASAAALVLAARGRSVAAWPPLLLAAASAGACSFTSVVAPSRCDPVYLPRGAEVAVLGRLVRGAPAGRRNATLYMDCRAAQVGDQVVPLRGMLAAEAVQAPPVDAGHDVVAVGRVAGPTGRWPGDAFGAAPEVRLAAVTLRDAAVVAADRAPRFSGGDLRAIVAGRIRAVSPWSGDEVTTGVMLSTVFGANSSGLTREVVDRFRASGTVHVLVVSGAQVALVAAVGFWLGAWLRLSLAWSAVAAGVLVAGYASMIPGAGTIWRALGMVGVLGLARLGHRPVTTEQALVVTVFGVSVVSPLSLLDASLQLSALAVLGAVLGMRHLGGRERRGAPEPVHVRAAHAARAIVGASLGATVATTPLVAGLSGLVSWVGPLANLIAVPIAAALTVVMLLAAIFAFAVPAVGGGLTYVGGWMARVLVTTSSWLGEQQWAAHRGEPWPTWLVIAAYGAIAGGLLVASSIRRRRTARERSEPSHGRATEATGGEPGPGSRPEAR